MVNNPEMIDRAVDWLDKNMTMLYSICTKDENAQCIPDYIFKVLQCHQRNSKKRKENNQ